MKKRKGTYTVNESTTVEQPDDDASTAQAKKKSKKHKKDKCLTNHDADSRTGLGNMEETSVMTKKKKKKKKQKDSDDVEANDSQRESETGAENPEDNSLETQRKEKKKKKKKDKCIDHTSIEVTCKLVENGGSKKGHKKKNKVLPVDAEEVTDLQPADIDTEDRGSPSKKKGKKRKNQSVDETEETDEEAAKKVKKDDSEECEEVSRKKKKHKDKDDSFEAAAVNVSNPESDTLKKKKKKKRKHTEIDECEAEVETVQEEDSETVSKKKKKRKHVDIEDNVDKDDSVTECPDTPSGHGSEGSKKKKKKRKNKEVTEEEDVPTKANNLKEQKEYVNGDDSVTHSPEVPSESNSQDNSSAGNNSMLGQWKTASFDTGDRQSKFFRLLGGFKKSSDSTDSSLERKKAGLFKGLSLPGSSGNFALSATEQSKLHNNLESQFEKARTLAVGKQKGGGLGFTAPPGEGKKFYIDTGNTKSVKFD